MGKVALIGGGLWLLTSAFSSGPVHQPDGVMAPDEPVQTPLATPKVWHQDGWTYQGLAEYDISARIMHTERYRFDPTSDIAPLDLGVGWGMASDQKLADKLNLSNSGRFLSWNSREDGIDWDRLSLCMANMHMIPATDGVRSRLLDLREGQIVRVQGTLVEVLKPGMNPWRSSLTRRDTGNGACEIMWVESVTVLR